MSAEAEEVEALPENYEEIPLGAMQYSTRRKLSLYLNLEGILNDDVQCINNYLGLAELAGFGPLEIRNFELKENATDSLIVEWACRPELSPTIGKLWKLLTLLGRDDVLIDCRSYINKDCEAYLEKKARFPPKKESKASQRPVVPPHHDSNNPLSVGDVIEGTPTLYDAFVCYNPDGRDIDFVNLLITKLEDENGLKLFVPERDDLPGLSASTTSAKLIQHRCKRMLIILSPSFLESPSCDFQSKFAHSISPGARSKKLVPILIENCVIPEILQHMSRCDYTRKELIAWFWTRLVQSLKAPLDPEEEDNLGNLLSMRQEFESSSSFTSDSLSKEFGKLSCSSSSVTSDSNRSGPSLLYSRTPASLAVSHSPAPKRITQQQQDNRSHSPGLTTRQADGYVLVDKPSPNKSSSPRPEVPPVANRPPLNTARINTPPQHRGVKSSPQAVRVNSPQNNRAVNSLNMNGSGSGSPSGNRGTGSPRNRSLPQSPVCSINEEGNKVYYC